MLFRIRLTLVALAISVPARAQPAPEELFDELRASTASLSQTTPAGQAVLDRAAVGMRIDRLFGTADGPAQRVQLNVGVHRWVARLERLDRDMAGFRSWVGAVEGIEHSHVVFTERDRVVSGLIDAVSAIYQLRTVTEGLYVLEQLDAAAFKAELEPIPGLDSPSAADRSSMVQDDGSQIDVLVLYTPSARTVAGGIAQIQALASQVVSDGNTIFARSGVVTRLRLVSATELPLVEAPNLVSDLFALKDSALAASLRDSTHADLVQLLVSSLDSSACGIGYQLPSLLANFDAYSVADVACVGQYTPAHEMAHNMGSHHAPEDGAFGGLFPYSYGFKDLTRGFRTVMAYSCAGASCPRIPNFSNPLGSHNGGPTGTDLQNNALSLNAAAPTVANWRQGRTVTAPPLAPTNLRVQSLGTFALGAWDPSDHAYSYIVQVGSSPGAADVFNAPIGSTTAIAGSLLPGLYSWRVIATNTAGSSPPSVEGQFSVACVPPGAPHSFTFSVSGNIVTLNWLPPATGGPVTGYIIEAGSGPGLANLYNGPTGGAQPGGVTPAPPGIYYVRLRAQTPCGVSGPSNEQVITVQ